MSERIVIDPGHGGLDPGAVNGFILGLGNEIAYGLVLALGL